MPSGLQIGLLILGAMLLIATLPPVLSKVAGGGVAPFARQLLRAALGIAGATLIVWSLASYSGSASRAGESGAPTPVSAASAPPAPTSAAAGAASAPVDLIGKASEALDDCALATAPAVPDGASASLSQMTAAQGAFKAYDAATVRYVACVDAAVDRISAQFAGLATAADLQRLRTFGNSAHNSAIDKEQALADQLNAQVRAYNARHVGQPPRPHA